MTKYIRKVVHLELENRNLCRLNSKQVAYYKIEDRNNRCKIMLFIEGILPLRTMCFYVITGEGDRYHLRKIKTVNFSEDKVNDTYTFDQLSAEDIKGCLIMESQKEPFEKENVLLYAMHDTGISLENLQWNDLNEKRDLEQKIRNEAVNSLSEADHKMSEDQANSNKQHISREVHYETNKETNFQPKKVEDFKVMPPDYWDRILQEEVYNNIQQATIEKPQDTDILLGSQESQGTQKPQFTQNPESTQSSQFTQDPQSTQGTPKMNPNVNTLEYIKSQLELNEAMDVMHALFEKNQEMKPFNHPEDRTEWVKIEITDLVFLPLESWLLVNNAFLMTCYRKYKHLILGKNEEEKLLKLGIPDIYYFKESLIANVCGFHEFFPCSGASPKSGEYGYWIISTRL